MINDKKCSKCGEVRPISEFAVYDGKPWCQCKSCQRIASKSYRDRFPDKKREQTISYREKNPGYSAAHSRKWRAENRERHLAANRARYQREKAAFVIINRKKNLAKYGLTVEQYEQMYREQNGVCAICAKINLNGRRLSVDHNHNTMKVRALLCSNCNIAIGNAKENIVFLRGMIAYLEKHETLAALEIK